MTLLDACERDWAGRSSPIELPGVGREEHLPGLFAYLGFRRGVEVGVEQGVYSETLCRAAPDLELHCVDCWQAHKGYRDHVNQDKLDGFYAATRRRLAPYNAHIHRGWSVEVARDFSDGFFDFVYIDANHNLQSVIADLAAWVPKVRKGGVISGHDYK